VVSPAPIYVLDSFAPLAHLQAEPGGPTVRALLESARDQKAVLYMSLINAGEVYYLTSREKGRAQAEALLNDLSNLPIVLRPVTDAQVWQAARLKSEFLISYADAFAVALAQELKATLVTGDPELADLKSQVKILWLPSA